MKNTIRKMTKLLLVVCVAALAVSFAVCAADTSSTGTTAKNGWVKKTYYYKNGKKVKNKWLKLNGSKYYFDKKGKVVKGVAVIDAKFYVFKTNGKLNNAKTKKYQSLAKYENDFAALKKLLGEPVKSTYGYSCYGAGQDGVLEYKKYTVFTYAENGKEIYLGVQGK